MIGYREDYRKKPLYQSSDIYLEWYGRTLYPPELLRHLTTSFMVTEEAAMLQYYTVVRKFHVNDNRWKIFNFTKPYFRWHTCERVPLRIIIPNQQWRKTPRSINSKWDNMVWEKWTVLLCKYWPKESNAPTRRKNLNIWTPTRLLLDTNWFVVIFYLHSLCLGDDGRVVLSACNKHS